MDVEIVPAIVHIGCSIPFADWQQFVANKIAAWEEMNTHWAKNYTGQLMIVYYEDLIADVDGTLRTILQFIEFPIDNVSVGTLDRHDMSE